MPATTLAKVAVVICSTRTPRVGPKVAEWVKSVIDSRFENGDAIYELVDVADFKLPVFDEPILPAMVPAKGNFTKEHSKKWSAHMAQFAAFIFVTPEYNYGIPSSTKNAVDYLYNEITTKPAMVVSYGIQGGKIASESLKTTLEGMKLRLVKIRPALPFHGGPGPDMFGAAGKGELGEDSRKDWEEDKKKDVLEGVAELEQLMKEDVIPKKGE